MHQAEFELHVGKENICPHITAALQRAAILHSGDVEAMAVGV
jgi:hypothetical protein